MLIATDIAFANLGWVVIDNNTVVECGVIKTVKDKRKTVKVADDFAARCMKISEELLEIIKRYENNGNPIKGLIGELPHGSQNARASKSLGGAVGVVTSIATCCNLPCEWISEGDSKFATLGKRKATKDETMDWARSVYSDAEFPTQKGKFEHIADALMAYNGMRSGILVRTFG